MIYSKVKNSKSFSFIIANLVEPNGKKNTLVGYKVLTIGLGGNNELKVDCQLLKPTSIQAQIFNLMNGAFVNNELKGSQGDFKRYPTLSVVDGRCMEYPPIVILGMDSEGYYLIVDNPMVEETDKIIRRVSPYELKYIVKRHKGNLDGIRVANARVDCSDVKKVTIRPIKGKFDTIVDVYEFVEKDFDFGMKQGNRSHRWKVRVVKNGEPYGLDYCLKHKDEKSLVEFYDLDESKDMFPIGQHVGVYYIDSIKDKTGGLWVNGNSEKWSITSECMKEIRDWLNCVNL